LNNFHWEQDGLIHQKKFSKMILAETLLSLPVLDSLGVIPSDFTCHNTSEVFIPLIKQNTVSETLLL